MPVNPIVPNTAECRVHFGLPGNEEMVNVLNLLIGSATFDDTLAGAVFTAVADAYNDNLIPLMSNLVELQTMVLTDLRTDPGGQRKLQVNQLGALSDNILPTQVSAVVRWSTDTRGRSFQGRSYIGGFTEANSAGQSPTPTLLTALASFATQLRVDLGTADAPLAVVSRYETNPTPPPSSIPRVTNLSTEVTGYFVDQAWHTRRSRALKG